MKKENNQVIPKEINITKEYYDNIQKWNGNFKRHNLRAWKFPNLIAIISNGRTNAGYGGLYEGTWSFPYNIEIINPSLTKAIKLAQFPVYYTERPRERNFNYAINSYEEKIGEIFQKENLLIMPIIEQHFDTYKKSNGWVEQSIEPYKTTKRELKFEIPKEFQ